MKAILFENGIEFKRGEYPRKDIGPIPDLLPSLEWKLIVEGSKPAADLRLYTLQAIETNTNVAHPQYPHLSQYQINYTIQQRSDAQIIALLENIEKEVNETVAKEQSRMKMLFVGLGILIKQAEGTPPTAPEQAILDKIKAKAVNIWQNHQTLQVKKASLPALPNPDSNWNTNDEE